tara:strand:- start:6907 stop:7116 length:210 start_codon:yes stop_codon:yes gene_type:complete
MVLIKYHFYLALVGFVTSGFGGGMLFSFQYITLDNITLVGSIVSMVGLGLLLFTLTKLKGYWSFEVVEE